MKSSPIPKNHYPKLKIDTSSSQGCTEDSESLIEDIQEIKNAKLKKYSTNNIQIISVRQLPTLFFLIFIIIVALIMSKSVPQIVAVSNNSLLYKDKMRMKYVPELIGEQTMAVKVLIISSQLILAVMIFYLSSLIRQRISVPELMKEKWRNYVIILSSLVSMLMMTTLLFNNKETLYFSKHYLGLADNIVFLLYLTSCFVYSLMSFVLLTKFNIREIPKSGSLITFKKGLILLMGVQLFCYFFSLILVSFYHPYIKQEKALLSLLVLCISINSIIFLLCQVLFVFSLKYDLYYVSLNLQIRPDLEYFVDLNDASFFRSTL